MDLLTGKFQWQEFILQAAFMAGTSFIPTVLVTIPLGVTLGIPFLVLAGQIGATSLAGAPTAMFTIRQGASLASALLLAPRWSSSVWH